MSLCLEAKCVKKVRTICSCLTSICRRHALKGSTDLAEAAIISKSPWVPLRVGETPETIGQTNQTTFIARHVMYKGASSRGCQTTTHSIYIALYVMESWLISAFKSKLVNLTGYLFMLGQPTLISLPSDISHFGDSCILCASIRAETCKHSRPGQLQDICMKCPALKHHLHSPVLT